MTAVETRPAGLVETSPRHRPLGARVQAFVALTKPRIIELLLITTVPVMFLAAGGVPDLWRVVATMIGGYLSAGGANALNMYIDRDIDALMHRTEQRPLVTGMVSPREGLVFGISLSVVSTVWFALLVNPLSAALSLTAILYYVFVYTLWLKRSTPQTIVIGGAAGAMPPLIGWAAVTNGVAWAPIEMFAIVFLWTPPHFWALALRFQDDYERAQIPMLPVVRGQRETLRQILFYSLALVGSSLLLVPTRTVGVTYAAIAVILGAGFLWFTWRLLRRPGPRAAMGLFRYSISYLSLLFVGMALDQLAQHWFGRIW